MPLHAMCEHLARTERLTRWRCCCEMATAPRFPFVSRAWSGKGIAPFGGARLSVVSDKKKRVCQEHWVIQSSRLEGSWNAMFHWILDLPTIWNFIWTSEDFAFLGNYSQPMVWNRCTDHSWGLRTECKRAASKQSSVVHLQPTNGKKNGQNSEAVLHWPTPPLVQCIWWPYELRRAANINCWESILSWYGISYISICILQTKRKTYPMHGTVWIGYALLHRPESCRSHQQRCPFS